MHAEILQRLHRRRDRREQRNADVLDKHLLRRRRTTLHAIEHDDVGTGFHCKVDVEVRAARADLQINGFLPIGDFTQLLNLDLEIIRARPVRMPACGALIDALRKLTHFRDAVGNLLPEQHTAAAGFRTLPDHDLDRIGFSKIVRVHAVARRQILIDEIFRLSALFWRHAAVARRGRRPRCRGAASERFLSVCRQRTEAHSGNRDRNRKLQRLLRKAIAEHDFRPAFLAISFQRIPRHRCAEKKKIVEIRKPPLRPAAADIIDTRCSRTPDFGQRVVIEGRRRARSRGWPRPFMLGHQYAPALSMLKL